MADCPQVICDTIKVGNATLWKVLNKSLAKIIQEEKESVWEDNYLLITRLEGINQLKRLRWREAPS